MAHDKMFGICENKCLVEVSPKSKTDADHQANADKLPVGVGLDIDATKKLIVEIEQADGTKLSNNIQIPSGGIEAVNEWPSNPIPNTWYGKVPSYGMWAQPEIRYYLGKTFDENAVYSLIYDKSLASDPSACLTYAGACEGFTPIGTGSSNMGSWGQNLNDLFDNVKTGYFNSRTDLTWTEDEDKSNMTCSYGKWHFTKIPKIYEKVTDLGNQKVQLDLSLTPFEGSRLHKAFIVDDVEKDNIYISRYLISDANYANPYYSNLPLVSKTRAQFRQIAKNCGSNFGIMNYWDRDLVNKFVLMGLKTFDTQSFGRGYVDGNSSANNMMSPDYDWMYGSNDGSKTVTFLGLSDWWGNVYQWIDDYVISSGNIYVGTNSNPTDNTSNKTNIGQFGGSSGSYPLKCKAGIDNFFISEASGGSENTGMCDYQYWSTESGPYIAYAGGHWDSGSGAGAFYFISSSSVSGSSSSVGARLTYKP